MNQKLIMENWRRFLNEAKNKDGKEKGVDGKACWKGKKYAGSVDTDGDGTPDKDKCVPMEEVQDAAQLDEDEKKKKCEPSKGKRFAKRVDGKCRSFGQAGKESDGTDRIEPGTDKGHAYCARSAKIKKCKEPPCANDLSRKKWKCQGDRSVP